MSAVIPTISRDICVIRMYEGFHSPSLKLLAEALIPPPPKFKANIYPAP